MATTKKKRAADNYITDQDWDDEPEEKEEPGIFKVADDDVLSKRVIKKATRRGLPSGASESSKPSIFSGFKGFGDSSTVQQDSGVATLFPIKPSINTKTEMSTATTSSSFWASKSAEKTDFFSNRVKSNTSEEKSSSSDSKPQEVYLQQLSMLNTSVLSWIKLHVEKNPCIDLTPVFKDYTKHLNELEKEKEETSVNTQTKEQTSEMADTPVVQPASIPKSFFFKDNFASSTPIQNDNVAKAVPKFGEKFFTPPAFSSTSANNERAEVSNENNGDAPPVPERKTIIEEDAFHQVRSKLFFMKGTEWQELGMGMLYLKPSGNASVQLLIRMETSTGKILLNINLTESTPVSRSGKNNVMVVSTPNPPVYANSKDGDNAVPCTYLIRVKGTVEADALFSKMKP